MVWHDYISVNPAVVHGKACIRGTRIPVAVVLANLHSTAGASSSVCSRWSIGLPPGSKCR